MVPRCSIMLHLWNIYLQNWVIYGVNVGTYSIHGAHGYHILHAKTSLINNHCVWAGILSTATKRNPCLFKRLPIPIQRHSLLSHSQICRVFSKRKRPTTSATIVTCTWFGGQEFNPTDLFKIFGSPSSCGWFVPETAAHSAGLGWSLPSHSVQNQVNMAISKQYRVSITKIQIKKDIWYINLNYLNWVGTPHI